MKQTLLYEGKAKRIYSTINEDIIVEFKDSLTAGDGAKKGSFANKGKINCEVTKIIFKLLNNVGFDTHFIKEFKGESKNQSSKEKPALICHNASIIPLEIVVRNISAGSFSKRYGINEGIKLQKPIVELFVKDDNLHDPLITDEAAIALDYINKEELSYIQTIALQINAVLQELFEKMNLQLVDYKLEFGRDSKDKKRIILADEITQDTVRLWNKDTNEKMDKDRFRRNLGRVKETYEEFLKELIEIPKEIKNDISTTAFLTIELKNGIIDSVGDVTLRSLQQLGFTDVTNVNAGKTISVKSNGPLNNKLLEDIKIMNSKILANQLIEKTTIRFCRGEY